MLKLNVNGKVHQVDVEADMPLLWVLRDHIGLPGTKYGCGIAVCGACTVHVDGAAVRSCSLPASAVVGKKVLTIEGLGQRGLHKLQASWIAQQVPQCGYCQSGMLMAAADCTSCRPAGSRSRCRNAVIARVAC